MKSSNRAILIMAAATIVLGAFGLFYVMGEMKYDSTIDLTVGTYGEHVYTYQFNTETLAFTETGRMNAVDPSYALGVRKADGEGTDIYAVSEKGGESGVYSFSDGIVTGENHQTGADPCFLMLHGDRYMLTADYSGGSISIFSLKDRTVHEMCQKLTFSGSGPVKGRQNSSHIHQVRPVPQQEEHILATDLGADVIRLVHVNEAAEENMFTHIEDIPCPAGTGPRHMEFSKDGKMLYCLGELSGEVLAYEILWKDGKPYFRLKQRVLADEVNAGGSADIHMHPSGKWLYTSHRLDNDGIATFSIRTDGTLEKIGYNKTARHPRNFMITDDGAFILVACLNDKVVQVFRISEDGTPTLTPSVLRFGKDSPSSITAVR